MEKANLGKTYILERKRWRVVGYTCLDCKNKFSTLSRALNHNKYCRHKVKDNVKIWNFKKDNK